MKKIVGLIITACAFSLSSLAQNYYKVDSLPKSDSAYHKIKKDTLYTPKKDSTKNKDSEILYPIQLKKNEPLQKDERH